MSVGLFGLGSWRSNWMSRRKSMIGLFRNFRSVLIIWRLRDRYYDFVVSGCSYSLIRRDKNVI